MFRILSILILLPSISISGEPIDFARDVLPILADNCFACHGPDEQTREADLRLDLRKAAAHVLTAEPNILLAKITAVDAEERMPPPESKQHLTAEQIWTLRRWVENGARYGKHWAFVPPQRPAIPDVRGKTWPANPIDHFVLSKLEERGFYPSRRASAETLIRRVTLDLIGLPPTPDQVDAFVTDKAPSALEAVMGRLMDSPKYGERMAAPWLDLARYADTDGYQNDRYRYQHVWRDWVIMAFNENMPYDQFLMEQLAGDMLPQATLKQQIATGFCRNHRINSEDGSIPDEWHVEYVVDRVDTLGTAILGLTMGCARCHDHKYDPLTQKEYYRLFGYFNNVPEWGVGPNNGNSPPFVKVPKSWPNLSPAENVARTPEPLKLRPARKNDAGNGLQRPQAGDPSTVMVMAERKTPRKTYRLIRGQYNLPDESEVLAPGVPAFLGNPEEQPKNRLELAAWLVDRAHPLTARVAVNRLWQDFFGVGLVKTSENFGLQGELPSHPKLLDWLAVTLIDSGWDLRAIQKLILTSSTYQQASHVTAELVALDPENRWLARGPRFRLHPFMLRDQALAASGLLSEKIGGPSARPYMPPKIWRAISNNTYTQDQGENLYRRSFYTYWRRTIPPPIMMNFNAAAREVCVVRTQQTNTPLQALTMMNNIIFVEASRFLAERMMRAAEADNRRIEFGFRLLTARTPTESESYLLRDAYDAFLANYRGDVASAEQLLETGAKPRDKRLDVAEHAALTMVASLIMNLDEVVTKE